MMTLRLNQLVYTSFQNSGLQLLVSTQVSPEVQGLFKEQVIEQYWDPANPYDAQYQAAYIHQVSPQDSFFGWIYNEETDQGCVPIFHCYHLKGALSPDLLAIIFACLQQGPVEQIRLQEPPPSLADLGLEAIEGYQAARSGIAVPQDIQSESFSAVEHDELLSLFVPSLGESHSLPLEQVNAPLVSSGTEHKVNHQHSVSRQHVVKAGMAIGGLLAALLGLAFYKMRPAPVLTTAPAEEKPSAQGDNAPIANLGQQQSLPQVQVRPKLGPQLPESSQAPGTQQAPETPRVQSTSQASRLLTQQLRTAEERQKIAALQAASRRSQSFVKQRQSLASQQQRIQPDKQTSATVLSSAVAASQGSEKTFFDALRRSSPSTAPLQTAAGVNLDRLLPDSVRRNSASSPSESVASVPSVSTSPVAPPAPSAPRAAAASPTPKESLTTTPVLPPEPPPQIALPVPVAAQPKPEAAPELVSPASVAVNDDAASRLADIAASQELANVLTRGLVVANRAGKVPYRSSTYLKIQSVIRRLRGGANWNTAAHQSGISDELIVNLVQLAYDADLDAASVVVTKGVTTHDIANAIARGLVIADRSGAVRYRSYTYRKVQDVIYRLRLGQNRHYAARSSGVKQSLIEKLLTWGGLPPAVVSFQPQQSPELKPLG